MALEREQATYARERSNLMSDFGKFAVICEDAVAGIYDTHDDAMKVAYERFGLNAFMVTQIGVDEVPRRFTRDLADPRRV
jgi:hypothetical protein